MIGSENIELVPKFKILGVILDQGLSWRDHIEMISCQLSLFIGILKKCREQLNRKWLITLYSNFLLPHMIYCILIWGHTPPTSIRKIEFLQKRALKIMLGLKMRSSSNNVFIQAKVL